MAPSARVTSLEALEHFKASLSSFGVDAGNALAGLAMQVQRAFDWLEAQGKFWHREVRRREELVTRAKGDLLQSKAMSKASGRGYSEQEIALQAAQEALREARTKLANCKRWAVLLPQELIEFETPARQLTGFLEGDLRRAVGLLGQKVLALEAYLALEAPARSEAGSTPEAKAAEAGAPEAGPSPAPQPAQEGASSP